MTVRKSLWIIFLGIMALAIAVFLLVGKKVTATPLTDFSKVLASDISSTTTTIPLNNLRLTDGLTDLVVSTDLGSEIFVVIDLEKSIKREIVRCTGSATTTNSATLTGCTRGLAFFGTSTLGNSSLQKTHNRGATVTVDNVHYTYSGGGSSSVFTNATATTLGVSGLSNLNTLIFTDATGTSLYISGLLNAVSSFVSSFTTTNSTTTNSVITNSTSTNGFSTRWNFTNGTGTSLGLTSLLINSVLPCLKDGTNCPAVSADTDTLATVTNRGNSATSTVFLYGGLTVSNLTVTGTVDGITTVTSVNSLISYGATTGTLGMPVSAGQPLFISTTGTLFLASSATSSAAFGYVGVAKQSGILGDSIFYSRGGATVEGQSGLSTGWWYYLQDAQGTIGRIPGTIPVRIGLAVSSTTMVLTSPAFSGRAAGDQSISFNGVETNIVTGFVPTRIDVVCNIGSTGGTGSMGWWQALSNGASSTASIGANSNAGVWFSNRQACNWNEAGNNFNLTISTTTNGFLMISKGTNSNRTVLWTATVDDVEMPNLP